MTDADPASKTLKICISSKTTEKAQSNNFIIDLCSVISVGRKVRLWAPHTSYHMGNRHKVTALCIFISSLLIGASFSIGIIRCRSELLIPYSEDVKNMWQLVFTSPYLQAWQQTVTHSRTYIYIYIYIYKRLDYMYEWEVLWTCIQEQASHAHPINYSRLIQT
jgi:hypothetical protein